MRYTLILAALFFSGCSEAEKAQAAATEFMENCNGPVYAEMRVGSWDKHLVLRCDDMNDWSL